MKRSLVIIVTLLLLLTACQPTPEVDAVRQKNQGDMIDMAKTAPVGVFETKEAVHVQVETQAPDFRALYDIPEHLTRELTGAEGRLVVHIDADVKVPTKAMPIVRVHPVDFSQEFVSQLWDKLIGDTEMYIESNERTKEVIEKQMEYYLSIADGEYDNGMETPEEALEELKRLQEEYLTAPEGKPPERADGTLQQLEVTSEQGAHWASYTGLEAYDPKTYKSFRVRNNCDNDTLIQGKGEGLPVTRGAGLYYNSSGNTPHPYDPRERYPRIWVNRDDPLPEGVDNFLKTTPGEAWERAESILKEMGLSDSFQVAAVRLMPDVDWEVSSLGRTITKGIKGYAYQTHFSRMVRGVPCNSTQRFSIYLFSFKDLTAPSWQPEQMELWFDDGPDYSFSWASPQATDEVLVEDSTLLPFDSILDIVEKRLPLLLDDYARDKRLGEEGLSVDINRVALGLWRIREKDSVETGLLVPAWCFYLDMDIHTEDYDGGRRPEDLLIINAVDGTLIDPWNGY